VDQLTSNQTFQGAGAGGGGGGGGGGGRGGHRAAAQRHCDFTVPTQFKPACRPKSPGTNPQITSYRGVNETNLEIFSPTASFATHARSLASPASTASSSCSRSSRAACTKTRRRKKNHLVGYGRVCTRWCLELPLRCLLQLSARVLAGVEHCVARHSSSTWTICCLVSWSMDTSGGANWCSSGLMSAFVVSFIWD